MLDIAAKLSSDKVKQVLPEYIEARKTLGESLSRVMDPNFLDRIINAYTGK